MHTRKGLADRFWYVALLILLSGLLLVSAFARAPATKATTPASAQQDVIRLENRLTLLEQRFYSVEASIRSLEQQLRLGSATSRSAGQEEIRQLRVENEALRQRLAEMECGLAKLDERTLTASMREARRKSSGGAIDPCRLNADLPLRLTGLK